MFPGIIPTDQLYNFSSSIVMDGCRSSSGAVAAPDVMGDPIARAEDASRRIHLGEQLQEAVVFGDLDRLKALLPDFPGLQLTEVVDVFCRNLLSLDFLHHERW